MCVCAHTHTQTHTYACMHACMHTYKHSYMQYKIVCLSILTEWTLWDIYFYTFIFLFFSEELDKNLLWRHRQGSVSHICCKWWTWQASVDASIHEGHIKGPHCSWKQGQRKVTKCLNVFLMLHLHVFSKLSVLKKNNT